MYKTSVAGFAYVFVPLDEKTAFSKCMSDIPLVEHYLQTFLGCLNGVAAADF